MDFLENFENFTELWVELKKMRDFLDYFDSVLKIGGSK
jgi:hypothetical protein